MPDEAAAVAVAEAHDDLPSDEAIDAFVAAPPVAVAPVAPQEPVVVPAAEPQAQAPADAAQPQPAADPNAQPAQQQHSDLDADGVPKRFYTKHMSGEQKALLAAMLHNPDATPEEALTIANRKLGRETSTTVQPSSTAAEPTLNDVQPPSPDPLTALETELAAIDADLEAAAGEDGVGSVFNASIKAKLDRKLELATEIAFARRDAAAAARREAAEIAKADNDATQTAVQRFPDLARNDSPMTVKAAERINELKTLKTLADRDPSLMRNPDVALQLAQFTHPNFANMLADEVARELGISPVVQAQPNGTNGNHHPTTSTQQGVSPAPNGQQAQAQPGMAPMSGAAGASHRVTVAETSPLSRFQAAALAAAPGDIDAADAMLDEYLGGGVAEGKTVRFR